MEWWTKHYKIYSYIKLIAHLFFTKGAFSLCPDGPLLSHHGEELGLGLLLVGGAAVRVEFASLVAKLLLLAPSLHGAQKINGIHTTPCLK